MMFYKETDFHESPIGKIPKEWEVKATEDLFIIETGTTPSTAQETYWKNGTVNWLTPTDLSKLDGKLRIRGSERKITEKALKETNLTLMPKGSIILSTRAPVGYVATLEEEATFNQGCKGLIPRRTNELFPEFYTYYLSNKQKVLQNLSCGSTFLELSKNRLEQFSMPYLPVPEQRAVVGVLGVVDSAIELADQVIAKTERLKQGLMQQLLTRGIGHTETKQTPIGKLAKNWQVFSLQEICEVTDGAHWSPKAAKKGDYKIATVANLKDKRIDIESCKSITSEDYDRLVRMGAVPEENDILFSKDGTIGVSFVFEQKRYKVGLLSSIAILKPNQKMVFPKFGSYALQSPAVFRQVIGWKTGTAIGRITIEHLKVIRIPIPPLSEQKKIAEILTSIDTKLEIERKEKTKLIRIKHSLMDLLLTGKVRIKVD